MRILVLTTTYAARGHGASIRRVALALRAHGLDVTVIAPDGAEPDPFVAPVVEYPPVVSPRDRLSWVLQTNSALEATAAAHVRARGADVVHAIGWEVAWAATGLKESLRTPLVSTVAREVPARGLSDEHHRIAREARAWLLRECSPRGRSLPQRASARTVIAAYERAISLGARRKPERTAAPVADEAGSLA